MTAGTGRRAELAIEGSRDHQHQLHFNASNGEPLAVSETHPRLDGVKEARKAWIRAMVEVLEGDGYRVTPPPGELVDPLVDSDVPGELAP